MYRASTAFRGPTHARASHHLDDDPVSFSITEDDSLATARPMMIRHRVRHLPVTCDGKLVGIVSDRDAKNALGKELDTDSAKEMWVAEACVYDFFSAEMRSPLASVLQTMAERHIGAAIVTRSGELAGIFAAADACRAFADYLDGKFPRRETPDAA